MRSHNPVSQLVWNQLSCLGCIQARPTPGLSREDIPQTTWQLWNTSVTVVELEFIHQHVYSRHVTTYSKNFTQRGVGSRKWPHSASESCTVTSICKFHSNQHRAKLWDYPFLLQNEPHWDKHKNQIPGSSTTQSSTPQWDLDPIIVIFFWFWNKTTVIFICCKNLKCRNIKKW